MKGCEEFLSILIDQLPMGVYDEHIDIIQLRGGMMNEL